MHAGKINNATRDLAKPFDWDEKRDGPCGSLWIRDGSIGTVPTMTSAWKPSPEDLKVLNDGGVIELLICGVSHPPVSLTAVYEKD